MKLYLIQHGNAVDKEVDPDRPLTSKGAADVEAVARFLAGAQLEIPEVWHSGKTRARQTAEMLAQHIGPHAKIKEKQGLKPNDDVTPLCEEIRERDKDVAVVGHLPHLARLASALLVGADQPKIVAFEQGGAVCLESTEPPSWQLRWMVIPALLPH